MKAEGDKIIFENRKEVESIQKALEEHLKANDNEGAKRLCDLLDVMLLNW